MIYTDVEARMKEVVDTWNKAAGISPINPVRNVIEGGQTHRSLGARVKDATFMKGYREAIDKIVHSAFCCGGNSRNWKAKLPWFVKPGTLDKILQGDYDSNQTWWIERDGLRQYELPSLVTPRDTVLDKHNT